MAASVVITYTPVESPQDYQTAQRQIATCQVGNHDYMILSDLRLSSLPTEIGMLRNLEAFCGFDLGLVSIPEVLCTLPKLQRLCLSFNKISSLTSSIIKLSTLKEVNLRGNDLTTLSPLQSLTRLEFVDLSDNLINNFPMYEMGMLIKLKQIHLENNRIIRISSFNLTSLSHLTIWMQGNPLEGSTREMLSTLDCTYPLIYYKA